ncbi:MarC family protein [Pelagibacteraceae bacterium]|jgi:multiple antibiotic resistance protein|nr:MarC family protein [Pelagibacteraceae bacterium]
MLEIFFQTFVLYFVVIDPLAAAPLFLIVTQGLKVKNKLKTAFEATLIATLILMFFAILGNFILSYLQISLSAFTIAGGIILFIISLEMLFDKRSQRKEDEIKESSSATSIFPLAIPLLAGPAAITSVIVSVADMGKNLVNQATGLLALILVMILTFVSFYVVSKSSKIINKKVTSVVSRVIGIILAGLSVQFILDGIQKIF